MSEDNANCSEECSKCNKDCDKRSFKVKLNKESSVKKVIGILSGKGGVGKSLVTSLLAARMAKRGHSVAILDADITGPSIPEAFGITKKARAEGEALLPVVTEKGIKIMSMNLLLEKEGDPVIWRGPVISGVVKQFWSDVIWKEVDYMFVDMPPGTGDVPLTIFQSLPVDALIVVSSPQQLVRVIVEKAVNMATIMKVPILGIIENMSYVKCGKCGESITVFGKSNIEEIARQYNIPVLARIPIEERISFSIDSGDIENLDCTYLDNTCLAIESKLKI